ncbi:MAG: glycosyltransferase family 2 protein [Pleurocapsa sp. SU_5_0]|nr:glycosyltransferase family 2 protein [Pleurocapsa sp. SU_5_0]NJO96559.1 glycosyltransferase family 2 protein [Pleurocapsa sp. CRU_1_2]NJR45720.1 glycosyltransferase family 2 protein [Hyellaceae cyanobacterium CSU_1_1]
MVKVSVIIPAYNGDRYLAEAIDSVLQQTYQDYEIIVVDDGSTDHTAQVAQQYGKTIRYLTQTNQGVAASRNLGLAAALGDYIAFLDQDDILLPHKLSSQTALLDQDTDLGMVNSGWQIYRGNSISDCQDTAEAAVKPWEQIPQLTSADLIIWKPVFLGAMLFRRNWLERVGGFNTSLEQTPDVDLVMRLAKIGCPAAWVEQITVKYRQHETNASKNALLQAQELNQITANFFTESNLTPAIKTVEAQSRYQSLIWSAWRLHQTGYLAEMRNYLSESQAYSDQYSSKIPLDWLKSFKNYSAEYGQQFDVNTLLASDEWQDLLYQCVL